jgi:hypothetical protein
MHGSDTYVMPIVLNIELLTINEAAEFSGFIQNMTIYLQLTKIGHMRVQHWADLIRPGWLTESDPSLIMYLSEYY